MEHISPTTDRLIRIPRIAWILGGGVLVALAAIFVFNVPASTVLYYGFIVLMIGSHFFMHGSHGGHGGQAGQAGHEQHSNTSASTDDSTGAAQTKDKQTGHSGGCH